MSGDQLLSVSWLPLVLLSCWTSVCSRGSLFCSVMGSLCFLFQEFFDADSWPYSMGMVGMRPNQTRNKRDLSPSSLALALA